VRSLPTDFTVDFKALIALAEKCEPTERSRTVIMTIVLKYQGVCSNRNISSGLAFSLSISIKGAEGRRREKRKREKERWGGRCRRFPLFLSCINSNPDA
jgi:hypothetical protein